MPSKVAAKVVYRGKMRFEGTSRDNPPVPIDYHPPLGDGQGYLGMELLLLSLAACSGQTVAGLLRKMKQPPREMEVVASGEKRDEHPTTFLSVKLEFVIRGGGVTEDAARQAVALSEEKFCPVWATLKPVVPVSTAIRVE
jgi:putative redox protein